MNQVWNVRVHFQFLTRGKWDYLIEEASSDISLGVVIKIVSEINDAIILCFIKLCQYEYKT